MISGLYAGLLGFLFLKISSDTIGARRKHQISLGTGKNDEIIGIVSAHSNFVAYVFFFLLQLYIVEHSMKIPSVFIHVLGLSFLAGRIFHFIALKGKMNFKYRKLGMVLTFLPILVCSIVNIVIFFL